MRKSPTAQGGQTDFRRSPQVQSSSTPISEITTKHIASVDRNDARMRRFLGEEGSQIITALLDPFHDSEYNFPGLPDSNTQKTVCQIVKRSFTVSAPSGTVGTWSAVLFNTKLDRRQLCSACIKDSGTKGFGNWDGGAFVSDTGPARGYRGCNPQSQMDFGTLNCWSWNTDNGQFFPRTDKLWVPPANAISVGVLTNNSTVFSGYTEEGSVRYRVPGMGYEIRNTTASIYKQGTCTTVRVPAGHSQEFVTGHQKPDAWQIPVPITLALGNAGIGYTQQLYDSFIFPPDTLDSAMLSGAIQREAAEGSYSVNVTDLENCTLDRDIQRYCAFSDGNYQAGSSRTGLLYANAYADCGLDFANPIGAGYTPVVNGFGALQHYTERDVIATYMTGLSAQTTFTVTFVAVVEIAPTDYDINYRTLVPLKRIPPTENERLLDLYQHAARRLPSSVPVSMNPMGEWWAKVVDGLISATKFASKNLAPLLGPEMAIAGDVVHKVVSMVPRQGTVMKKKKKTKQQAPPKKKKKVIARRTTNNSRG